MSCPFYLVKDGRVSDSHSLSDLSSDETWTRALENVIERGVDQARVNTMLLACISRYGMPDQLEDTYKNLLTCNFLKVNFELVIIAMRYGHFDIASELLRRVDVKNIEEEALDEFKDIFRLIIQESNTREELQAGYKLVATLGNIYWDQLDEELFDLEIDTVNNGMKQLTIREAVTIYNLLLAGGANAEAYVARVAVNEHVIVAAGEEDFGEQESSSEEEEDDSSGNDLVDAATSEDEEVEEQPVINYAAGNKYVEKLGAQLNYDYNKLQEKKRALQKTLNDNKHDPEKVKKIKLLLVKLDDSNTKDDAAKAEKQSTVEIKALTNKVNRTKREFIPAFDQLKNEYNAKIAEIQVLSSKNVGEKARWTKELENMLEAKRIALTLFNDKHIASLKSLEVQLDQQKRFHKRNFAQLDGELNLSDAVLNELMEDFEAKQRTLYQLSKEEAKYKDTKKDALNSIKEFAAKLDEANLAKAIETGDEKLVELQETIEKYEAKLKKLYKAVEEHPARMNRIEENWTLTMGRINTIKKKIKRKSPETYNKIVELEKKAQKTASSSSSPYVEIKIKESSEEDFSSEGEIIEDDTSADEVDTPEEMDQSVDEQIDSDETESEQEESGTGDPLVGKERSSNDLHYKQSLAIKRTVAELKAKFDEYKAGGGKLLYDEYSATTPLREAKENLEAFREIHRENRNELTEGHKEDDRINYVNEPILTRNFTSSTKLKVVPDDDGELIGPDKKCGCIIL